jgi:tetratricopeptide (TPR) repeat protein
MIRLGSLLFTALFLLGAAPPPIDPNALNREGAEASARGDYAKAAELFRQALAVEPNQSILKYNLFSALNSLSVDAARKGQVDTAIQACSEALSLVPEDVRAASNLAIFFQNQAVNLMKDKHFDMAREAIANAEKVVDQFKLDNLSPAVRATHARTYLLEAREAFKRNEVGKAQELYARCIEINPDEALAYLDRSRINYEQEFFQDAVSDLELAAQILGETPQISALIKRIQLEASSKGQPVSSQDAYFKVDVQSANPVQAQALKRLLKELRLQVARNLSVNPKAPILISVNWGEPLAGVDQWTSTPGKRIEPDRIQIGGERVEVGDPAFRKVLRFHYLSSLALNVGGSSVPYWFAAGLGLSIEEGALNLTGAESEQLLSAGENFLLFRVGDLTADKISRLEDSKQVHLAYLESKGLVAHLMDSIRTNGLRQLMRAMAEGVPFDQALKDVANLSADDIEREWRNSMGLPAG